MIRKFINAFLIALPRLLLSSRPAGSVLYMPLNASASIFLNIAAIIVGRMRGYRIVIHHHVYAYLNNKSRLVSFLNYFLNQKSLQIVLCPGMLDLMRRQYRIRSSCAVVPSTIMLSADNNSVGPKDNNSIKRPLLRMGHLSNLTVSKGALEVIETFVLVRNQGHKIKLVMAGPICEPEVEKAIAKCQTRFGNDFEYRGPLYGPAKDEFFSEIDVFLFPTRYKNEAQPIVLSEAFQHGNPAITILRSCIPSLLGDNKHWGVSIDDDYVAEATRKIVHWINTPNVFQEERIAAYKQADLLREGAQIALNAFASWVYQGSEDGFVIPPR